MPLELFEDEQGDPRNARAMAMAADLAYMPEAEGVAGFRDQLGMEAKLLSIDNTQTYVACNNDHIVVAFRGTEAGASFEALKDSLLTDAVNLLIVPDGRFGTDFIAAGVGARFHKGFMDALNEIWEPLFAEVKAQRDQRDRPLWITGHSLGGALALLGGWLFLRRFVPVHQIVTFGAPMIGNAAACQAFDKEFAGKIHRYINAHDPVPKLPFLSLLANDYGHVEREWLLGPASDAPDSVVGFLKDMGSKTVDGMLNASLADDIWNWIKNQAGSHALTKYHTLLKE